MSYIIGLEEPGHGKEGLGRLRGPKMLPLSVKTALATAATTTSHLQLNADIVMMMICASNLVEEVNDLGEDVQASPWVDWGLVKNPSLQNRTEHVTT